ncbi:MAG TPA: dihydrofolate reductase family protein [Vicinamibacterales bacterium]|jgi:dihydrofolate reductase
MRRIVVFDWLTADGHFAAANGSLDWVVPDPEQVHAAVDEIPRFDTLLFGRKTFELFQGFWRGAVDEARTAPDPHRPGHRTREHGAIGIWLNEAIKIVFSKTLKDVTWKNARVLHHLDAREIERLKRQNGKDMMVFGSASIVSQLARHNLIDEYHLVVCPVLIGGGRPLLDGLSRHLTLNLLEARTYGSGDVVLRYSAANKRFP